MMNKKGFTLVETLIGMMLFVIILGGIGIILPSSLKLYNYSFQQGVNQQDGRQTLNEITNELRYASSISSIAEDKIQYDTNKIITCDKVKKSITITKNEITTKTLAKGRVSSLVFKDDSDTDSKKKEIKVTITFLSGDVITTKIMTLNEI